MSLTYAGELSLAAIVPEVGIQIGLDVTSVSAQLTAALAASVSIGISPPTLAFSVTVATQLLADLQAALTAGAPDVSASLSASISANIVVLTALKASLEILVGLLTTGGVFAYSWSGTGATFGSDVAASVGAVWPDATPNTVPANAIVLATVTPATWTAMQGFFAGV